MDRMTSDVPHVLVVENDEDAGHCLKDRCQSRGCQVQIARTGAAAIVIAATHDLHAVILDLSLPDMEGVEVLRSLKEIDPTILTVVLASGLHAQVKKEAIALGAFACLVKPYNGRDLDSLLSWAIEVKSCRAKKPKVLLSDSLHALQSGAVGRS